MTQPIDEALTGWSAPGPSPPTHASALSWLRLPFLPASGARLADRLTLGRVFAVHIVCAVLSAAIIFVLVSAGQIAPLSFESAGERLRENANRLLVACWARPWLALSILIGAILVLEIVFLLLAVVFMPWGARDEPARESLRSSLRRTWIRTPHIPVLALIVGGSVLSLGALDTAYRRDHPHTVHWPKEYPASVTLTPSDPGFAQADAAYDAAVTQYEAEFSAARLEDIAWRQTQPWYLRYADSLIFATVLLCIAWFFCGMLGSIGADRAVIPIARPPMCDFCGYNLSTIPNDSRCPECGVPVTDSLGAHVRPGECWETRSHIGLLRAWWRSARRAIAAPRSMGRCLRITGHEYDHRAFAALHLVAIFLIGALAVVALVIVTGGFDDIARNPENAIVSGAFGVVCALGTLVVINGAALVIGAVETLRTKRNMFPAAIRAACYLVGFLVPWEVFGGALGVCWIWLDQLRYFEALREISDIPADMIAFWSWTLPNLALGVIYLVLVARATSAMRFANQ